MKLVVRIAPMVPLGMENCASIYSFILPFIHSITHLLSFFSFFFLPSFFLSVSIIIPSIHSYQFILKDTDEAGSEDSPYGAPGDGELCIHLFIHPSIHSSIHPFIHSFIQSPIFFLSFLSFSFLLSFFSIFPFLSSFHLFIPINSF